MADLAKFKFDNVEYSLDLSLLTNEEAEQCEQFTGWTWVEWLRALFEDESRPPRAMQFLLWLVLSRDQDEPPKFSDVKFNVLSFEWVDDSDENTTQVDDADRPTSPAPDSTATSELVAELVID